jgi:type I restriction enzyme M protein
MQSGYLLRDVLDKANEIHFSSSDQIHTLGHFYESMLKEMRDAAGDSGEFYTPRPLVRMIVAVVDPRAGETILDPAAGTAGFLAVSYEHLKPLCRTVEEMEQLQRSTLCGIEAKSLPYPNVLRPGGRSPSADSPRENRASAMATLVSRAAPKRNQSPPASRCLSLD